MARQISVEIVGDSASLERAFARSSKSAARFGRDMDKTSRRTSHSFASMRRTLVGGAATLGLGAALKSSVSAASDLEQQVSKTNVVFGQSAQAVEDWSKTLAQSFGLSEREALTLASTFGALFAPLGIIGKQAADQSRRLVELGADLASFYNTDVQDALDAIQSGLVGQARPLRRYGILLDAARVQQEALIETGKRHASQLTNQDKVLARIALIFKDSKKAQGDFARTADQAAQQTKILSANVENLKEQLGGALVPYLARATGALNEFFVALSGGEQQGAVKGQGVETTLVPVLAKRIAAYKKAGLKGKEILRLLRKQIGDSDKANDLIAEAFLFSRDRKLRARLRKQARPDTTDPTRPDGLTKAQIAKLKAAREAARQAAQERRSRIRQANEAARQEVLDRAEFAVERTTATKTLKDDLVALRRYNALLTRRIRGGHGTLDLEREQFRVQQQIADVLKKQADLAKRTQKQLGVDVTRFQKTATGQFVLAGAAGAGRGVLIQGGVHLHGIQNVSQLENELARRSKQRAHQRRHR